MITEAAHDPVIRCTQLTKRFGKSVALRDVTLSLPRGEVIGLIGRNGSGKTTLLQHCTGLQLPTSGTCAVFGVPSERLGARELSRIGTVVQHGRLITWMSVRELRRHVAAFFDRWDDALVTDVLSRFSLDPDARVGNLSPGEIQALQLALAIGHRPELLLLDEPLSDLDPTARRTLLDVLLEVFERDRPTVVISSHLLHDIEPVITRVVALADGRLTVNEDLDALKDRHGMNLEQLFPLLTGGEYGVASASATMVVTEGHTA